MIKTVLRIEHIDHSLCNRLHHDNARIEVGPLVCIPYDPVYECSEEIALTELNDPGRILIGLSRLSV